MVNLLARTKIPIDIKSTSTIFSQKYILANKRRGVATDVVTTGESKPTNTNTPPTNTKALARVLKVGIKIPNTIAITPANFLYHHGA